MDKKPDTDLKTGLMGQESSIKRSDLFKMQKSQYILHARDGKLDKIGVEKSLIPHDPKGHDQSVCLSVTADGIVYVSQPTVMSRSDDGGKTWKSHKVDDGGDVEILSDATFLRASADSGPGAEGPAEIFSSTDEGRTWNTWSKIELNLPVKHTSRYFPRSLTRISDDLLIWGVQARGVEYIGNTDDDIVGYVNGDHYLFSYRSRDGGINWEGPVVMLASGYGSEGGVVKLPSGKLLATIRYSRPGWKHVWLVESNDDGLTWINGRQLTTVHGQCHGQPTALLDGTVLVIYDHRYGPNGKKALDLPMNKPITYPGVPGGRAMVSLDEGNTWQDESYYLYYGDADSGYNQSALLDDGTILTIVGTSDYPDAAKKWDGGIGKSDLTAIRWNLAGD